MKIIISPAKTMKIDREAHDVRRLPAFLDETAILMDEIRKLSFDDAKKLWKCSHKLAELNFKRFAEMDLKKSLTPAVFAYEGLQYKNMGPKVFSHEALEYIEKHLRILSGFYGILRPFDGVTPYRLEMQAELSVGKYKNLYEFWGEKLYSSLETEHREEHDEAEKSPLMILDLASKEYSKAIKEHIGGNCRFVTVVFGEFEGGKIKQKATQAKMARGDMVRFLAEGNITHIDEVKTYTGFGFKFSRELSESGKLVFIKKSSPVSAKIF